VQTALARLYVAWLRVRRSGKQAIAYTWRIVVHAHIDEVRRPRWKREQYVAELPDEFGVGGSGDLGGFDVAWVNGAAVRAEGLDVPEIETVLMLRATESPVVFLQQLGRGLRRSPGKDALTVIDLIGNHRSFLTRPRTLLGLGSGGQASTARVLRAMQTGEFGLPPGCSATYDLELVDILRAITRVGARSAIEDYCRSYVDERGHRPCRSTKPGTTPQRFRLCMGTGSRFWTTSICLTERNAR
jgi:hypothetical protein